MNYQVKFDEHNSNAIIITQNGKLITMVALPPIEKGCDIINFSDKLSKGYTFNFDGLVLITTKGARHLYYKGDIIAATVR